MSFFFLEEIHTLPPVVLTSQEVYVLWSERFVDAIKSKDLQRVTEAIQEAPLEKKKHLNDWVCDVLFLHFDPNVASLVCKHFALPDLNLKDLYEDVLRNPDILPFVLSLPQSRTQPFNQAYYDSLGENKKKNYLKMSQKTYTQALFELYECAWGKVYPKDTYEEEIRLKMLSEMEANHPTLAQDLLENMIQPHSRGYTDFDCKFFEFLHHPDFLKTYLSQATSTPSFSWDKIIGSSKPRDHFLSSCSLDSFMSYLEIIQHFGQKDTWSAIIKEKQDKKRLYLSFEEEFLSGENCQDTKIYKQAEATKSLDRPNLFRSLASELNHYINRTRVQDPKSSEIELLKRFFHFHADRLKQSDFSFDMDMLSGPKLMHAYDYILASNPKVSMLLAQTPSGKEIFRFSLFDDHSPAQDIIFKGIVKYYNPHKVCELVTLFSEFETFVDTRGNNVFHLYSQTHFDKSPKTAIKMLKTSPSLFLSKNNDGKDVLDILRDKGMSQEDISLVEKEMLKHALHEQGTPPSLQKKPPKRLL